MFADRADAGEQLAVALRETGVELDLVLAVPRGGLPVGRAVADAYGVPLDIVAAKKLGAPHNPELAIGAAAGDGSVWLNGPLISRLGVDDDYLDAETVRALETAREKADAYRGGRPRMDVDGMRVAVVDDGVATGATTRACLTAVRDEGASAVILAVPVGPPDTVSELAALADAVVCLETPPGFAAVGQFYRSFGQVTDREAITYLDRD